MRLWKCCTGVVVSGNMFRYLSVSSIFVYSICLHDGVPSRMSGECVRGRTKWILIWP